MNEVFATIPANGLLQPGSVYIFLSNKDRGWEPGPVEYLSVITREDEIALGIEIEFFYLREWYELLEFVKVTEILVDVYEFRFRCWDIAAKKEIGYSLYLHRLPTIAENLPAVRENIVNV